MAHRQLADDYRAKLRDAQDRIFALEGIIADRDHEIEELKASTATTNCTHDGGDRSRVAELEIALLESQKRLQDALNGVPIEDEGFGVDVEDESSYRQDYVKAENEIKKLREQNEALRSHVADLKQHITESNTVARRGDTVLEIASLRSEIASLTSQLETYKTAEAALRQKLGQAGGKDLADAVYIDALRSQIKDLTGAQSSMQVTVATLLKQVEKTKAKRDRVTSLLEARDKFVEKLKSQLAREKEARMAMASSKTSCSKVCEYCKICNPTVINLDQDDEEPVKHEPPKSEPADEKRPSWLDSSVPASDVLSGSRNEFT